MIINTGRGLLIHTNALIEGLKTKKVSAAGLDVYEEEGDYFYEDKSDKIIDDDVLARLLSFNNVIVTSHQAFFTKEALHRRYYLAEHQGFRGRPSLSERSDQVNSKKELLFIADLLYFCGHCLVGTQQWLF
mgnify:CR=1 FL=1